MSVGGTPVSIHTTGDPRGFFSLAGPLLAPTVRGNIAHDLAALKHLLEAH